MEKYSNFSAKLYIIHYTLSKIAEIERKNLDNIKKIY